MVAVITDKKTSLHKHKMGARDSMLGYLISTRFLESIQYPEILVCTLLALVIRVFSKQDYLNFEHTSLGLGKRQSNVSVKINNFL